MSSFRNMLMAKAGGSGDYTILRDAWIGGGGSITFDINNDKSATEFNLFVNCAGVKTRRFIYCSDIDNNIVCSLQCNSAETILTIRAFVDRQFKYTEVSSGELYANFNENNMYINNVLRNRRGASTNTITKNPIKHIEIYTYADKAPALFNKFQAIDDNGIFIDLCPAIRNRDGAVGVYDAVSGGFWTSDNGTEFVLVNAPDGA